MKNNYFDASEITCSHIVNYDRYPIDQPDHQNYKNCVQNIQAGLAKDGCAVLPDFLSANGLDSLLKEAESRKPDAYYSPSKLCNVYLGDGNPDRDNDHPQNIFIERNNGFVTADTFGANSASFRLYNWPPLRKFLADCLNKKKLYIYADPVSNMIVNVGQPGQTFNWHFDTNEFTITMLLQAPESGGHFEYAPDLRKSDDECYDDVKKVLDGDHSRVRKLPLNPGDLQFFLGRYSMHRVTKNTGSTDRLLLIMSFTEQPGLIGSMYRVKDLYGKITDAHVDNEKERRRNDQLLD